MSDSIERRLERLEYQLVQLNERISCIENSVMTPKELKHNYILGLRLWIRRLFKIKHVIGRQA